MAPGTYNGTNHGGLHTGTGKHQKAGVYSSNGRRYEKIPNKDFTIGVEVQYVGTHKDFIRVRGLVVSKDGDSHRTSRSIVKVEHSDKVTYFHKNNLLIL